MARALEVLGERWTLLILRDLMFGIRRFDDLQSSLGISPGILTTRLGTLAAEGLVERVRYQDKPERFEYRPTEMAVDLIPVIFHLVKWGDKYRATDLGPPRDSLHRNCGGHVDERRMCHRCAQTVWFDQIDMPSLREVPADSDSRGSRP